MLFEIFDKHGDIKMSTTYESCIYSLDVLESMKSAGYKFKLDGRSVTNLKSLHIPTKSSTSNKPINLFDIKPSNTNSKYTVRWRLCKRSKSYDDVEVKSKVFDTYDAAISFLEAKSINTPTNYWAGGQIEDAISTIVNIIEVGG